MNEQINSKFSKILMVLAVLLFVVFIAGLLWLAGARAHIAEGSFGFMSLLAFTAGLSMIILPCTLPLVFIIIPLAVGKDYKKAFVMALLFGLGLTITISFYGLAMAFTGKIFGIKAAAPWMLLVAGLAAYLFGLAELNLFQIPLPFLPTILPPALQKKNDYIKSFMLGLLLGNAGIGCPNPLFYVLLFYIAGTANIMAGTLLGFIHGLGRALPIILLTILAMFGYQATDVLLEQRFSIKKISSWLLLMIGIFLIPAGIFNLRGWWFLSKPPYLPAIVVAVGLTLLPLFLVYFFRKEKIRD